MPDSADLVKRLFEGDPTLFEGDTARHALGWLHHPEAYLGDWLDQTYASLPRRHQRTILLGMGGSSGPARLYAQSRPKNQLTVLDTSNPDTISSIDFSNAQVIASSKSGGTIETQTLLAHALVHGLDAKDLIIITDPGTALVELGESLGAHIVLGDPATGGRYSGLSPFGLVPALYADWTIAQLRDELASCFLSEELVALAVEVADQRAKAIKNGEAFFPVNGDPITSGAALWMEQLVAETTGKDNRGFIPMPTSGQNEYRVSEMQGHHLVAALLGRHLGVDPFNQPNDESAKKNVFSLLSGEISWAQRHEDLGAMREDMMSSTYNVLQVYAPLSTSEELSSLRSRCESVYGPTTANLGPRYLHSTGQLHKGGPTGVVGIQLVQRPVTEPARIEGRHYTFHDLHMAQATSDFQAMQAAKRKVYQFVVDDLQEAAGILGL